MPTKNERAVSLDNLWAVALAALDQEYDSRARLLQIYRQPDGSLWAVASVEPDYPLFVEVPMNLNTGAIDWDRLQQLGSLDSEAEEMSVSNLTIGRTSDGSSYRVMGVAATAVLNRVGEIDSVDLFNSFLEYDVEPEIRLCHAEEVVLGRCIYRAVDGYAYIIVADLPINEFTTRWVDHARANPGYWGWSIGYTGPENDEDVLEEVIDGIWVPVFRTGINHEVSIVPEALAAGIGTSVVIGDQDMNAALMEALKELFPDDEERTRFIGQVDGLNDTVRSAGLIVRVAEAPTEEGEEEGDTQDPKTSDPIVIDESVVEAIVARMTEGDVAEKLREPILAAITPQITSVSTGLETLQKSVQAALDQIAEQVVPIARALSDVEEDRAAPRTVVTYRPRNRTQSDADGQDDGEDVEKHVGTVLKNLPQY